MQIFVFELFEGGLVVKLSSFSVLKGTILIVRFDFYDFQAQLLHSCRLTALFALVVGPQQRLYTTLSPIPAEVLLLKCPKVDLLHSYINQLRLKA